MQPAPATASRPPPTRWEAEALWLRLEPLLSGLSIEVVPSLPSTNTTLLERLRKAADVQPCLLVAEQQTQGRGRLGREWLSREGASLTFSLALPLAPADWSGLSLAVGVALADALDPLPASDSATATATGTASSPRIGLKWPNDLWLTDELPGRGRKLGGILIETVSAGAQRIAVVGVGLNLLALPAAEAEVAAAQTTLSQGHASLSELTPECQGPQVLARVAEPLLRALLQFESAGFVPFAAAYARRDVLRGQTVSTTLAELPEGLAEGVDERGALCVRMGGGLHRVVSGEVSVRVRQTQAQAPAVQASAPSPLAWPVHQTLSA
jgi:BirA family biotin operon repressor/biotin-[acetyl-CoA-carboxylase] ligase